MTDKQTQQKEQRPEAQTKPDKEGEASAPSTQPEPAQAAPSGVPAVVANPLPPPVVNPDGTITYDIGEK